MGNFHFNNDVFMFYPNLSTRKECTRNKGGGGGGGGSSWQSQLHD